MSSDLKGLVKTAKRAVKLARIATAARKMAKSRNIEDRALAQRHLAGQLAQARGIAMKAGQILADREGFEELLPLVDGIPARPLAEVLGSIESALGANYEEIVDEIEEQATAASLGQVHRARLRDGRTVAIKVRYPDIDAAVDAELEIAGLLPGVGPMKKFGFNLGAYKVLLRGNMNRELDYRSEAERQHRYRETVQQPGLVVPRVYPELCSESVLVQSWEGGERLREAAQWPRRDRVMICRTLLATLFGSLFVGGEVHIDPNPGNYHFRRADSKGQPEVVLLDFGSTISVTATRRLAFLRLILDCREGNDRDLVRCLAAIGFETEKLHSIAPTLPSLCRILLEPLLVDRPFDIPNWKPGDRLQTLLGDLRWWFRSSGPPDSVFLLRAFSGLASQLKTFGVALPWWPILVMAVGEEKIEEARNLALPDLPITDDQADRFRSSAKFLKVRITRGDEEVVAMAMPAIEIVDLQSSLPTEVIGRIQATGIDLDTVVRDICSSGIEPQEVFALSTDSRHYRVWLE